MVEGKNIIAFSKEWENDWTSNHHVLTTLARKNTILWINSIGMRSPGLSSGKDWQRIIKKIFFWLRGPKQVRRNLYVFTPLVWPFSRPFAFRRSSFTFLTLQLRFLTLVLRMRPFQVWSFLPAAEPLVGRLGEQRSVYYCTDNWRLFAYLKDQHIKISALEEKLLKKVDVVFASSRFLCHEKKKINARTHLVTHGVNDIFLKYMESSPAPSDLQGIRHPVLGFYGWLRDTIDQRLLFELAQVYQDCSVVLIGKTSGNFERLRALSNIHFLGQKPYTELPRYAARFDVALIPYRMSPELMRATNPIKLKEYLALGLPLVTTDLPEAHPYEKACWIAKNNRDFILSVEKALGPEGKRRGALGKSMVMNETWEDKVEAISRIMAGIENGGLDKPAVPGRRNTAE
ncbi:MAG: glycosyltransferase [bacterium]